MRYLITTKTNEPFFTNWFDGDNHFNADIGMVVFDLHTNRYTKDGHKWQYVQVDNL